jgi:hypothetical protein
MPKSCPDVASGTRAVIPKGWAGNGYSPRPGGYDEEAEFPYSPVSYDFEWEAAANRLEVSDTM